MLYYINIQNTILPKLNNYNPKILNVYKQLKEIKIFKLYYYTLIL